MSAPIEEEICAPRRPRSRRSSSPTLGLAEPSLDRVIRASYELLGLISFFTVGEDEVRAWTIRRGTRAREAAGAIHSDIERGFIRAEVVRWDDLLRLKTLPPAATQACSAWKGRSTWCRTATSSHFRFNV